MLPLQDDFINGKIINKKKYKFMIKRTVLILLVAVFGLTSTLRANEGMWLLSLIGKNYQEMKAQGFRLTPEDIYNINRSSLKDAIVGLGTEENPFWHFCTAELISGEGLISTNHHCGFDMIQKHSTVEHDYLRDGFWAYKKSDELPKRLKKVQSTMLRW